jgi:hypothetical protein
LSTKLNFEVINGESELPIFEKVNYSVEELPIRDLLVFILLIEVLFTFIIPTLYTQSEITLFFHLYPGLYHPFRM